MKIYAVQIDPEYQSSHWDELFDMTGDIAIFGNSDYREFLPEVVKTVRETLDDGELCDVLENWSEWSDMYRNATEAILSYLPPEHKERYSTKEIHALRELVLEYAEDRSVDYSDILCQVLTIVTGKHWDHRTFTGSCQGDWNECYYASDVWANSALDRLESEYFNTGSEWVIHEGENAPIGPDDICGYSIYCTGWNDEQIKQEIADEAGCAIDDVIMYAWDGWYRKAKYRVVA